MYPEKELGSRVDDWEEGDMMWDRRRGGERIGRVGDPADELCLR